MVGWQDRAVSDAAQLRWLASEGPITCPYEADRLVLADERGAVTVCEGPSDVAALLAAFEDPAVVGIPGSSGFKTEWATAFDGLGVLVVPDNDQAGERFYADVSAKLAGHARLVRRLQVPEPHNDLAAWLTGCGDAERFGEAVLASAILP